MKKTVIMTIAVTLWGLLLLSGCQKVKITESGGLNGYSYVDLGLPSGTLWATCNVGANNPEERGDLFSWGETRIKNSYTWSNYKYGIKGDNEWEGYVKKYCSNSEYGVNGFTDNLKRLLPSDDVATVTWGEGWRIPTNNEFSELISECSWQSIKYNGTYGTLITGINGNSIFLPRFNCVMIIDTYNGGFYWSSMLCLESPDAAYSCDFGSGSSDDCEITTLPRSIGLAIRPVCSSR